MIKNDQAILNLDKSTAEINLSKNATYVVSDGKLEVLKMPESGYGEHVVEWLGGNMHRTINSETRKAVRVR